MKTPTVAITAAYYGPSSVTGIVIKVVSFACLSWSFRVQAIFYCIKHPEYVKITQFQKRL
jgi:hypothetical protein